MARMRDKYTRGLFLIALICIGVIAAMPAAVRPAKIVTLSDSAEAVPLVVHVDNYLRERQYAPDQTLRAKEYDLTHFVAFMAALEGRKPASIMYFQCTRSAIEAFRDYRLSEESPSSVARRLWTVKDFTKSLSERYHIDDPAKGVSVPQPQLGEFLGLTEVEIQRLLVAAEAQPAQHRFAVELLLSTGLRRSEARLLKLGQISDDWRYYLGVKCKGSRYRDVEITDVHRRQLMRFLNDFRQDFPTRPDYPLLVSIRDKTLRQPDTYQVSDSTFYRIVRDVMLDAGFERDRCHPHTLRHAFALKMLAFLSRQVGAAQALKTVQEMLGHADLKTTMRYLQQERDARYELVRNFA